MASKKRRLSKEDETNEDDIPAKKRKLVSKGGKSKKEEKEEGTAIKMYNKFYKDRNYELLELWQALKEKYKINSVLYPGCYIQVSPSFYFDYTVYVDSDKNAGKFFKLQDEVKQFIGARNESNQFKFYQQDYNQDIEEDEDGFDLLVSLYAGFVTDNNLKYVKQGGYVLVNNSHNDALNCYLKEEVKLVAVSDGKKIIDSKKKLEQCFVAKETKKVEAFKKSKNMKTIGFKKSFKYYIFQKT